jgi:uncharacterized protein
MSGETDLGKLLAGLSPQLDPVPYLFVTLAPGTPIPAGIVPLATFAEAEGLSLVVEAAQWPAGVGQASAPYARLTMLVHSALEAVGMTAAMAAALTKAGISANVVAAYYHDHVFVPWDRRHDALRAIEVLAKSAA